jgi:GH24 family phage-related lysozyme (muramidase)
MHQSVLDAFRAFSVKFEGEVSSMYVDVKGLVTAGIGNLAEPISLALAMPWLSGNGEALPSEVRIDWQRLKDEDARRLKAWTAYRTALEQWQANRDKNPANQTPEPAKPTTPRPLRELHYNYAAPFTSVRLSTAGINLMVQSKLLANEKLLRSYFPGWDGFPADAQLGICSMAWALGAGFPKTFQNFARAVNAGDWLGAVATCKIKEAGNAGVVPRNEANRLCFGNAATVLAHGMDPNVLHYPNAALPSPADDAPATVRDPGKTITDDDRARVDAQQFDLAEGIGDEVARSGRKEMSETHDTEPAPPPSASERRS